MTPLVVTATMASRVILPPEGLHLDALLVAAVARRDDLPPLYTAADVMAAGDVEIPIGMSPCGRYRLCSIAFAHGGGERETRWINKRFPLSEAIEFGDSGVRSVKTSAGLNKGYRIPVETALVSRLVWYAIGDGDRVLELLSLITRIGRLRRVGEGLVERWTVVANDDPWDGFPVLSPTGEPMRALPVDVAPDSGVRRFGRLRPPYWARIDEEEIACPQVM